MTNNSATPPRPLYIECGTTEHSLVNTGIQRVVRSIIKEVGTIGARYGFECTLIEFGADGFSPIRAAQIEQPVELPQEVQGRRSMIKGVLVLMDRILRDMCRLGLYMFLRRKLVHALRALGVMRRPEFVVDSVPPIEMASARSGELPPVLLLLDSTWNNAIWPHVEAFRAKGGIVCAVLYDLIPFTHPDTVNEPTRIAHTSWWNQAPLHVDAIMCISQSVRQDYLDWQSKRYLATPLPPEKVGYFYLGSEVSHTDPVVRLLTGGEPYFLMVGSLEPRKNHKTVLDAFDLLWKKGVAVRLAIIGAFGWKSEELLERIQNHPELNRQLFLVRDASDRDLTSLYGQTAGLIIASLSEGFGLPIVEAHQRGAAVICSDIPVFHEVAGERARYFEVLNPEALADQVVARLQEREHSCSAREEVVQPWINWRESTEQLLEQVSQFK